MDAPDRPHVRIFRGEIYVERVPNAWVMVMARADWDYLSEPERQFMLSKALKKGLDCVLPSSKTSGDSELPPIE